MEYEYEYEYLYWYHIGRAKHTAAGAVLYASLVVVVSNAALLVVLNVKS